MEIRPTTAGDLDHLIEIDGTVESTHYVHVEKSGEGMAMQWRTEERALRQKLIEPNPMDDEARFLLKQITSGVEEGLAMVVDFGGNKVGSLVAQVDAARGVLRLVDLRVDYDYRRQGLGSALLYRAIQEARERSLRAVMVTTRTNNIGAARLLAKSGFDLAGLDVQQHSNHDLVKEAVALFWYASLD